MAAVAVVEAPPLAPGTVTPGNGSGRDSSSLLPSLLSSWSDNDNTTAGAARTPSELSLSLLSSNDDEKDDDDDDDHITHPRGVQVSSELRNARQNYGGGLLSLSSSPYDDDDARGNFTTPDSLFFSRTSRKHRITIAIRKPSDAGT